ncbi:hypothetical protein HIMB5_00013250 [alpha proteobacterium HIMB5]|nr:hypothetical protein HIMB5_00013250 [alpha proteobacterium HIMB5]
MINNKKKIFSIFGLLVIISYFIGVLTYKYQMPPYTQIKFVYKKIFTKTKKLNFEERIFEQYMVKRKKFLSSHDTLPAVQLVKYSPGMNIWIDRGYYNKKNDDKIDDLYLIKHQRHNHKDIVIKSKKKLHIIRALCMLNDNSSYNNWKKLNYNLLIIGESCIHDKVISKEFGAGSIIISSGGMVASDPIFVKNLNNISEIEVIIKD